MNENFKFIFRKNRWLLPTYFILAVVIFFFIPDFGNIGAISSLITICWFCFVVYLADDLDSPPLSLFSYASILVVPVLALLVYFSGVADAYAKLQLSEQKAYDIRVVGSEMERKFIVLRRFDRGLIIRDPGQKSIEFIRWEEIRTVRKSIDSNMRHSLFCSATGWLCLHWYVQKPL